MNEKKESLLLPQSKHSDIQTKALELSKREHIDEFVASLGWIYSASQHSSNVTIARFAGVTRKITNKTSYCVSSPKSKKTTVSYYHGYVDVFHTINGYYYKVS